MKSQKTTKGKMSLLALCTVLFLCGCGSTGGDLMLALDAQEGDLETAQTLDAQEETIETTAERETEPVYVYVCGAVESPGVYCVEAGSRLFEVIGLAGGFLEDADQTSLNLARGVSDGEQVVVLTKEEAAQKMTLVSENAAAQTDDGLININTASLAELTQLFGIGESKAQAIISYREKHGAFSSIEEIKNVDGIADGVFSKIKDYIKV